MSSSPKPTGPDPAVWGIDAQWPWTPPGFLFIVPAVFTTGMRLGGKLDKKTAALSNFPEAISKLVELGESGKLQLWCDYDGYGDMRPLGREVFWRPDLQELFYRGQIPVKDDNLPANSGTFSDLAYPPRECWIFVRPDNLDRYVPPRPPASAEPPGVVKPERKSTARETSRPQRSKVRKVLDELLPNGVPTPAQLADKDLIKLVTDHPSCKHVSGKTVLREANRRR